MLVIIRFKAVKTLIAFQQFNHRTTAIQGARTVPVRPGRLQSSANQSNLHFPHSGDIGRLLRLACTTARVTPHVLLRKSLFWGMASVTRRHYPAAMETTPPHTFEVKITASGHYAVFLDGVRIALHTLEDDAHAHSLRLQLQAAEQPDAWGR